MKKLFESCVFFACFLNCAILQVSPSSNRYNYLQHQALPHTPYQSPLPSSSSTANQNHNQHHHLYSHSHHVHVAAASQQVPQVIGYHYPVPTIQLTAASVNRPLVKPGPTMATATATTTTTMTTTIANGNTNSSLPPTTMVVPTVSMSMTKAHPHMSSSSSSKGAAGAGMGPTVMSMPMPMSMSLPMLPSVSTHTHQQMQMHQQAHPSNLPQVTVTLQTVSDSAATSNQNIHTKPTAAGAGSSTNGNHGSSNGGGGGGGSTSSTDGRMAGMGMGSHTVMGSSSDETVGATDVSALADEFHPLRTPMIEGIDVACGKERMTVRVTFDQEFNGIVYAKGHYTDPNCRFVAPNSGHKMYQFDLTTGECGVSFIDSGLTNGGQAYVEGLLVIIAEPGVQEAWDAARKIRCLWEGNLEQTVTFPLSVNTMDQKLLTFSGDTASVALEIQSGRGPRSAPVSGLVRIGDMLTAVVTVQGDTEFDLLVRNCVATDGTPSNRIILSDNHGCAVKPKLMGGWLKQKTSSSVLAYAYLAAFKFPDVMDLFLECTVSLCKGECEECPDYTELHVPVIEQELRMAGPATTTGKPSSSTGAGASDPEGHGHGAESRMGISKTTSKRSSVKRNSINITKRTKRAAASPMRDFTIRSNHTGSGSEDSLRLRRVVHVIGPDDMPGFEGTGSAVYGNCHTDCISLMGVLLVVALTILLMMVTLAIYGSFRRQRQLDKC